jgi:SNF2 family DNA or RNA helicase
VLARRGDGAGRLLGRFGAVAPKLPREPAAIDRTHRIGQTRRVMVCRLIARETIEEKVVALARRKAALFNGVMDDGDLFASAITAEDIRGLLA